MLQPRQLLRLRLPASRHLSTSPLLLSKASKSRTGAKGKPSPKPFRSPSATLEALRGTGVGASSRLYGKDDAVVGRDEGAAESPAARKEAAAPSLFEAAAPAGEVQGGKEVEERLRGTGAGASELLYPKDGVHVTGRDEEGSASQAAPVAQTPVAAEAEIEARAFPSVAERQQAIERSKYADFGEEETIYTAQAPFNTPLVLTACFVFSVFALTGADSARVGLADYNEKTEEYELAPAWKRYTFASGFLIVAVGIVSWGALAPARIVTKLTLRRPLTPTIRAQFPSESIVAIHTPITSLPFLSPRAVPLSTIHLLGPLSTHPQPYHPTSPLTKPASAPKTGFFATRLASLRRTLIAPPRAPKARAWGASGSSHTPIIIQGDRASYSLSVRRGQSGMMGDPKGAWCEDWEGLERALLGVVEKK